MVMENDQNSIIHRRLVAGTTTLYNELKSLGFKELEAKGTGLRRKTIFGLNEGRVIVTYQKISLQIPNSTSKTGYEVEYEGLTVHDGLLNSFVKKITN